MHELALMQEVCHLALQAAAADGAHQITRIELTVGSGAGVDAMALRHAFSVVMAADAGHAAAGAELQLTVVPTRCWCPHCRQSFQPVDVIHACNRCGSLSSTVLQGRELEITALEVR